MAFCESVCFHEPSHIQHSIGGNSTADDLCGDGYEGPLCSRYGHTSMALLRHQPHPPPHHRCEERYFRDSFASACVSCSKTSQAAAPLIVIGVIVGLLLSIAACLYCFHYEKTLEWYKKNKEYLFMRMNHGTLVVSSGSARAQMLQVVLTPSTTPRSTPGKSCQAYLRLTPSVEEPRIRTHLACSCSSSSCSR